MASVTKPGDPLIIPKTHPRYEEAVEASMKLSERDWIESFWEWHYSWIRFRTKMAEQIQLQGRGFDLAKELIDSAIVETQEVLEKRGKYGKHGHPPEGPYKVASLAWEALSNFHARNSELSEAVAAMDTLCQHRRKG